MTLDFDRVKRHRSDGKVTKISEIIDILKVSSKLFLVHNYSIALLNYDMQDAGPYEPKREARCWFEMSV